MDRAVADPARRVVDRPCPSRSSRSEYRHLEERAVPPNGARPAVAAFMVYQRCLLFFASVLVFGGCSSTNESTGEAASNITHQDSRDLTVLSVEPLGGWIHVRQGVAVTSGEKPNAAGFDPRNCPSIGDRLDCTAEFETAFGVRALATIAISPNVALCQPLKISTVSKRAAFTRSRGIGAYFTVEPDNQDRGRVVSASDLGPGVDVRLKLAGEVVDGVVHELGVLGFCDTGGRFGRAEYKPFMRFVDEVGGVYDNWDANVASAVGSGGNYGATWNRFRLDRRAELLAP